MPTLAFSKESPVDMEFKRTAANRVFEEEGLSFGRCFGSKSAYRQKHSTCVFEPNSNVFCLEAGKLWWGDLDLAVDDDALNRVAARLGCRLYVLEELEGRFENTNRSRVLIPRKAVWKSGPPAVPLREEQTSGLNLTAVGRLLRVTPERFRTKQRSDVVLEIRRRFAWLQKCAQAAVQAEGFIGHWGKWLEAPSPTLGGLSPHGWACSGRPLDFQLFVGLGSRLPAPPIRLLCGHWL